MRVSPKPRAKVKTLGRAKGHGGAAPRQPARPGGRRQKPRQIREAEPLSVSYDSADAIAHLCASDPVLARVIAAQGGFGLELRPARSLFEALLRSIIYQQLHGRAAEAIHQRVLTVLRRHGSVSARTLARLPDEPLRAAGLSAGKLAALRDLAAKCAAGVIPTLAEARRQTELELIKRLTTVRGVGPWTVHVLMIFYLGHPDVVPVGDFAIRAAFRRLYRMRREPTAARILKQARKWAPYRSVASWYLWRSLDTVT